MAKSKKIPQIDLRTWIYRIIKRTNPKFGASKRAMGVFNQLANIALQKLLHAAVMAADHDRKKTIQNCHVSMATSILLGTELGKHALSEQARAVAKYETAIAKDEE